MQWQLRSQNMENESTQNNYRETHTKTQLYKIIGIFLVTLLIFCGAYLSKHRFPQNGETPDTEHLVQRVGELMLIPNETPIIATINQPENFVHEQPFYTGSQTGDMLLIFPQAARAVIYSPTKDIVINSGPFAVNSGSTDQNTPETPVVKK
jgi:hypothetical protein